MLVLSRKVMPSWTPRSWARASRRSQTPRRDVRHVLAAVVVADGEAAGDVLGEAAEVAADALAERLERLKAGGPVGSVEADALGRAVVDGNEDRDLALDRPDGGQVGAPHRVDAGGDDGAVVVAGATWRADPRRGEQAVHAHQAQHPALGGSHTFHTQPPPDLAMPFAMERATGKDGGDRRDQRRIGHRADGPGRRGGLP